MPANPRNGRRNTYGNNALPKDLSDALETLGSNADVNRKKKAIETLTRAIVGLSDEIEYLKDGAIDFDRTSKKIHDNLSDRLREHREQIRETNKENQKLREEDYEKAVADMDRRSAYIQSTWSNEDKSYRQFLQGRQQFRKSMSDQANKDMERQFTNYNDFLKKQTEKATELYEKQANATSKLQERYYKARIARIEDNIAQSTKATTKYYESVKDQLEDFQKAAWEQTLDEMNDKLEEFGKGIKKVADDSYDSWDSKFNDKTGILSSINETIKQLSGIDLAQAIGINSLASELDSDSKSRYNQRKELVASYGISTEQSDRWYKTILDYSSKYLHNALGGEEALEIMKQMADVGIRSDEDFNNTLPTILNTLVGNNVQIENLADILATDINQGYNGELLYASQNFVSAVSQLEDVNIKDTSKFSESLSDMINAAAKGFYNYSGQSMSQEQVINYGRSVAASTAAASTMMMGDNSLNDAVKAMNEKILSENNITGTSFATALSAVGVGNLDQFRQDLISGDNEKYFAAQQKIYEAILKSSLLRRSGTADSLWANEVLGDIGIEEEALENIAATFNSQDKINELLDKQAQYGIELADENIGNALGAKADEVGSMTGLRDQVIHGFNSWFEQSPFGDAWLWISGQFDVSMGDIFGQLNIIIALMTKSALFGGGGGGFGNLLKKILGGGGGTAGTAGGGFFGKLFGGGGSSAGGGFIGKIKNIFSGGKGLTGVQDSGLMTEGASVADYAKLWGKTPTTVPTTTAVNEPGIFSKLWNKVISPESALSIPSRADIANGAKNLFGSAKNTLSEGVNGIKNAFSGAKTGLGNMFSGFKEIALNAGPEGIVSPTNEMFSNMANGIGKFFTGQTGSSKLISMGDKMVGGIDKAITSVGSKAMGILSVVQGVAEGFEGAGKATEWFGEDPAREGENKASSFLGAFIAGAGDGIKKGGLWENLGEVGGNALKGAGIGTFLAPFTAGLSIPIGAGIGALFGAIGGDTVAQWFSPVVNWVSDTGKALMESPLVQGIANLSKAVWDCTLGAALDWLTDTIKNSPFGKWLEEQSAAVKNNAENQAEEDISGMSGKSTQEQINYATRKGYLQEQPKSNINVSQKPTQTDVQNAQKEYDWAKVIGEGGMASGEATKWLAQNQNADFLMRPSGFANGLSEVPNDEMLATLHKGEAVLTAQQASAVRADGGIDVSGNLSSSIREAIYGTNNGTSSESIYNAITTINKSQIDLGNKQLKYNQDSVGLLKQMSPSLNRLANSTGSGTYVAKSTFTASTRTPTTTPAGTKNDLTESLIDINTPNGNLTQPDVEGHPNLYVDDNGNQFVGNPGGTKVPVVDPSVAVRPKGTYATGTPFLPEDEVALIHQGEMIVPADKNPLGPSATATMPIPQDNEEIVEVLRWLGNVITRKIDEVEQTIQSTNRAYPAKSYQGPSMTDIAFRY